MAISLLSVAVLGNSNVLVFLSCVFITTLLAFGKHVLNVVKNFIHHHEIISYSDDDFYVGCQDMDGDDL